MIIYIIIILYIYDYMIILYNHICECSGIDYCKSGVEVTHCHSVQSWICIYHLSFHISYCKLYHCNIQQQFWYFLTSRDISGSTGKMQTNTLSKTIDLTRAAISMVFSSMDKSRLQSKRIKTDEEPSESRQCPGTGDFTPTVQTSKKVCFVAWTDAECFMSKSAKMASTFSRSFMVVCSRDRWRVSTVER